jgi:ABC-type multidrug transport system fused ATPase/permease subunit
MDGKTVIAIANRLSTIAAMDRLVIIDEGYIIEQGSHKELLAYRAPLQIRATQYNARDFTRRPL